MQRRQSDGKEQLEDDPMLRDNMRITVAEGRGQLTVAYRREEQQEEEKQRTVRPPTLMWQALIARHNLKEWVMRPTQSRFLLDHERILGSLRRLVEAIDKEVLNELQRLNGDGNDRQEEDSSKLAYCRDVWEGISTVLESACRVCNFIHEDAVGRLIEHSQPISVREQQARWQQYIIFAHRVVCAAEEAIWNLQKKSKTGLNDVEVIGNLISIFIFSVVFAIVVAGLGIPLSGLVGGIIIALSKGAVTFSLIQFISVGAGFFLGAALGAFFAYRHCTFPSRSCFFKTPADAGLEQKVTEFSKEIKTSIPSLKSLEEAYPSQQHPIRRSAQG